MRVKFYSITKALTWLGLGGVLAFMAWSLSGFSFGRAEPVWDARVIIDRILPAAKLVTIEAMSTQQLTLTDDLFEKKVLPKLIGREIQAGQTATLQVGYDLLDWQAEGNVAINVANRLVTVTMPEPELLSVVPDPASKTLFIKAGIFRNWDLTPEESIAIEQALADKFRAAQELPDLKERARAQLQSFLADLTKPHGYAVVVNFDADLSAASQTTTN